MTNQLLPLMFLLVPFAAHAQPSCPVPQIQVLRDGQLIPATGGPPAPKVTVRVAPDPACADQSSFRFRNAKLALMRRKRPVLPIMILNQPDADLSGLLSAAQPGDRIHVFILYKDLLLKTTSGKQVPYASLIQGIKPSYSQYDLGTIDGAQGISFTWPLLRP